jgi:oxygen-dependent protoporphyrinogen oxidase
MQPRNLEAVRRSPILGLVGKLRLRAEPLVRAPRSARESDHDESVASFATRRLGRQAFERLVEPLLAGIYVADATQLSLAATMPEFLAAEREHGSLRAALRASGAQQPASADPADGPAGTGARYGAFMTLRSGMGTLIDALAASLPPESICLSTPVASLAKKSNARWQATLADGSAEEFDGVIIAGPAAAAAHIVEGCDQQLRELLAQIQAASSVVVTLIYRQDQIARPLDAFGFVVPRVENRSILAASFPSVKFPGRGTPAQTPIRVFLGGALRPQAIARGDAELIATAQRELADLLGIRGVPSRATVARWPASMPQYRVGHLALVDAIERRVAAHAGLELVGASYRGVGIPQCVRSGRLAAERLAAG